MKVGIVVLTNGDGDQFSVGDYHKNSINDASSKSQFLSLSEALQKSLLNALNLTNQNFHDVMFLSYPDGMLNEMYFAAEHVVHRNFFTGITETYSAAVQDYNSAINGHSAVYSRHNLMSNLVEIISQKNRNQYLSLIRRMLIVITKRRIDLLVMLRLKQDIRTFYSLI
ncbi:MAG: hypothetical protein MK193_14545 [Lentisphaeria bacterium]|nr:hypothetical protein [Lentisphaeria bacterium]